MIPGAGFWGAGGDGYVTILTNTNQSRRGTQRAMKSKETVMHASGRFMMSGGQLVFVGNVTMTDDDHPRGKDVTGEFSRDDYNWGNFWPDEE